ncbi:hypothetical protein DH2020_030062 [Rehmannia glutinosa]|uniref:Phosphoglucomutase n=1 Tax=Rehmannia glutinosa TaxID=99300 RepID=A0ABR0VPB2_REHGL
MYENRTKQYNTCRYFQLCHLISIIHHSSTLKPSVVFYAELFFPVPLFLRHRFSLDSIASCSKNGSDIRKVVQHVLVAQCCQQDSQLSTQYRKDCCTLYRHNFIPYIRRKLAWTDISTMQLRTFSHFNRGIVYCNAAPSATIIQPVDKGAFLKLQNGSDIRGVAVDGVEAEPVSLTEPVTEAIAAAFAAWLLDRKKHDASRRLKVSIGHDSRISAQKLQDAVSLGLAGAGVDVIQYGYVKLSNEFLIKFMPDSFFLLQTSQLKLWTIFASQMNNVQKCDLESPKLACTKHTSSGKEEYAGLQTANCYFPLVYLFRLASTPAMFNSTLTKSEEFLCPVDGSIMITASHLPYNRNGFKFFTDAGGLGKVDIKDILERAADIHKNFTDEGLRTTVRKAAGNREKPLEGFHIVVDAGNGAGGFFAGKVLEPLGAITSGSQFLEPDGLFPNHIPNPEDKEAMKAITQAVLDNKADLGIIFDTDVDRSAAVDSSGRELNRNRLIALMSAIVLEEHPGTTIVTDSVTSDGLTTFIEKKLVSGVIEKEGWIGLELSYGLPVELRNSKEIVMATYRSHNSVGEESHLAIETSGHGALKENNWLDDGAYLMVKLLNKLASAKASGLGGGSKVLTDMVDGLEEPGVAVELRLKIDQNHTDLKGGSFREYGEAVLQHLSNITDSDPKLVKAPVNYEGIRVSGYGGWFLLRLSLHDPVLPLNIEAPSNEDAVKLGLTVLSAMREFQALDTSALDKFVQA